METRAYVHTRVLFYLLQQLRHILIKWGNKGREIARMGLNEVLADHRCLKLTEGAAQHVSCLSLVTGNNKDQRLTLNSDNAYHCVA